MASNSYFIDIYDAISLAHEVMIAAGDMAACKNSSGECRCRYAMNIISGARRYIMKILSDTRSGARVR